VERREIERLVEFSRRLKAKNGFYVSKVIDGIRVGISNFNFKKEFSVFVALNGRVNIADVKKATNEVGIPLQQVKISQNTLETTNKRLRFLLLKVVLAEGEPPYVLLQRVKEVKEKLSDFLFRERLFVDELVKSASAKEVAWEKEWAKRLAELSERDKMKIIVFPLPLLSHLLT